MEWIEGPSVREYLSDSLEMDTSDLKGLGAGVQTLMEKIGGTVGKLHDIDVVHGDLTTSNLMLREQKLDNTPKEGHLERLHDVVLIDFGLGQVSTSDEDKAVDLYVLERAFLSTHPKASALFNTILEAYKRSSIGSTIVLRRLQEVRLRGRKRSMIG
ncbi:hypothetical protein H072_2713 [Dactylellina haptotyla CBS 200.50]|uniref:EKC/KEOPS complex subunit BUD32 n=1 Tax=Dactylellina haptotyla (strain CBS 200.50) TaxID=1284197 RepID=S8C6D4_DACHA|nr:hypothetical protein H072_2713 [Dactylellina haptotyla CBS 200.50]